MAEEAPKGLLQRVVDKAGDKLGEKVGEWVLDFLKLAIWPILVAWLVLARHWVANEWACINKPWCEVRGWSLGVLIALAIAAIVVALYFGRGWFRTKRELRASKSELVEAQKSLAAKESKVTTAPRLPVRTAFQKIAVEDKRLKLRWFIRRPPHEWLHLRDVATRVSPQALQEILDGPFHSAAGCNAPLREISPPSAGYGRSSPTFEDHCPSCGQRVFWAASRPGFVHEKWVDVWPVRAQALEELQRMERNDSSVFERDPIALEKPDYWKLMLPPK
jgi:hypothetical protein